MKCAELKVCYGECSCSPKEFLECEFANDCSDEKNGLTEG